MKHPAYSLIFVFIIGTVLLISAASSAQYTYETLVTYRDSQGGTDAYLAATSAADDGIVAMQTHSAGYETTKKNSFTADLDKDGTNESWGSFEVYGNAQKNSNDPTNVFYVPIPGTGTAAHDGDCTVKDTDHDGTFDNNTSVNDPCNWNKMLYGQSASIPLYTDDGSGGLKFPYDLTDFNGWTLKVRTPCDATLPDNTNPETCTRYQLDSGSTYADDDSVILWQISGKGTDSTGKEVNVSVVPDDYTGKDKHGIATRTVPGSTNTEIYESLINTASAEVTDTYEVLKATDSDPYKPLYDACMGDTDGDPTTRELTLSDLSLQLNIVTPLKTSSGSVPYLEWQLTEDSLEPLADNKSVIIGEGWHTGTKYTFHRIISKVRSTIGESENIYTLSN